MDSVRSAFQDTGFTHSAKQLGTRSLYSMPVLGLFWTGGIKAGSFKQRPDIMHEISANRLRAAATSPRRLMPWYPQLVQTLLERLTLMPARSRSSFWSFLNSYATLFSLIFEGGLYPVMFMDYMGELLGK